MDDSQSQVNVNNSDAVVALLKSLHATLEKLKTIDKDAIQDARTYNSILEQREILLKRLEVVQNKINAGNAPGANFGQRMAGRRASQELTDLHTIAYTSYRSAMPFGDATQAIHGLDKAANNANSYSFEELQRLRQTVHDLKNRGASAFLTTDDAEFDNAQKFINKSLSRVKGPIEIAYRDRAVTHAHGLITSAGSASEVNDALALLQGIPRNLRNDSYQQAVLAGKTSLNNFNAQQTRSLAINNVTQEASLVRSMLPSPEIVGQMSNAELAKLEATVKQAKAKYERIVKEAQSVGVSLDPLSDLSPYISGRRSSLANQAELAKSRARADAERERDAKREAREAEKRRTEFRQSYNDAIDKVFGPAPSAAEQQQREERKSARRAELEAEKDEARRKNVSRFEELVQKRSGNAPKGWRDLFSVHAGLDADEEAEYSRLAKKVRKYDDMSLSDRARAALIGTRQPGTYGGVAEETNIGGKFKAGVTGVVQGLGLPFQGLGTVGAFYGATRIASGALGAYSELEGQRALLAGMLTTFNQFKNPDGTAKNFAANYDSSYNYGSELYYQIRRKAATSPITTKDMFDTFTTGYPFLAAKGVTPNQAIDIAGLVSSMGKMAGLRPESVRDDLRSLASGNYRNVQTFQMAGITPQEFKAMAQLQGDDFYKTFKRRFAGFDKALDEFGDTLEAKLSKGLDTLTQAGQKIGAKLAPDMKKGLDELQAIMQRWEKDGTLDKVAQLFSDFISKLTQFTVMLAEQLPNLIKVLEVGLLAKITKLIGSFVADIPMGGVGALMGNVGAINTGTLGGRLMMAGGRANQLLSYGANFAGPVAPGMLGGLGGVAQGVGASMGLQAGSGLALAGGAAALTSIAAGAYAGYDLINYFSTGKKGLLSGTASDFFLNKMGYQTDANAAFNQKRLNAISGMYDNDGNLLNEQVRAIRTLEGLNQVRFNKLSTDKLFTNADRDMLYNSGLALSDENRKKLIDNTFDERLSDVQSIYTKNRKKYQPFVNEELLKEFGKIELDTLKAKRGVKGDWNLDSLQANLLAQAEQDALIERLKRQDSVTKKRTWYATTDYDHYKRNGLAGINYNELLMDARKDDDFQKAVAQAVAESMAKVKRVMVRAVTLDESKIAELERTANPSLKQLATKAISDVKELILPSSVQNQTSAIAGAGNAGRTLLGIENDVRLEGEVFQSALGSRNYAGALMSALRTKDLLANQHQARIAQFQAEEVLRRAEISIPNGTYTQVTQNGGQTQLYHGGIETVFGNLGITGYNGAYSMLMEQAFNGTGITPEYMVPVFSQIGAFRGRAVYDQKALAKMNSVQRLFANDPIIMGKVGELANKYGTTPDIIHRIVEGESGFNPRNVTGTHSGLFQISPDEFNEAAQKGKPFPMTFDEYMGKGARSAQEVVSRQIDAFDHYLSFKGIKDGKNIVKAAGPYGAYIALAASGNIDQPDSKLLYPRGTDKFNRNAWKKFAGPEGITVKSVKDYIRAQKGLPMATLNPEDTKAFQDLTTKTIEYGRMYDAYMKTEDAFFAGRPDDEKKLGRSDNPFLKNNLIGMALMLNKDNPGMGDKLMQYVTTAPGSPQLAELAKYFQFNAKGSEFPTTAAQRFDQFMQRPDMTKYKAAYERIAALSQQVAQMNFNPFELMSKDINAQNEAVNKLNAQAKAADVFKTSMFKEDIDYSRSVLQNSKDYFGVTLQMQQEQATAHLTKAENQATLMKLGYMNTPMGQAMALERAASIDKEKIRARLRADIGKNVMNQYLTELAQAKVPLTPGAFTTQFMQANIEHRINTQMNAILNNPDSPEYQQIRAIEQKLRTDREAASVVDMNEQFGQSVLRGEASLNLRTNAPYQTIKEQIANAEARHSFESNKLIMGEFMRILPQEFNPLDVDRYMMEAGMRKSGELAALKAQHDINRRSIEMQAITGGQSSLTGYLSGKLGLGLGYTNYDVSMFDASTKMQLLREGIANPAAFLDNPLSAQLFGSDKISELTNLKNTDLTKFVQSMSALTLEIQRNTLATQENTRNETAKDIGRLNAQIRGLGNPLAADLSYAGRRASMLESIQNDAQLKTRQEILSEMGMSEEEYRSRYSENGEAGLRRDYIRRRIGSDLGGMSSPARYQLEFNRQRMFEGLQAGLEGFGRSGRLSDFFGGLAGASPRYDMFGSFMGSRVSYADWARSRGYDPNDLSRQQEYEQFKKVNLGNLYSGAAHIVSPALNKLIYGNRMNYGQEGATLGGIAAGAGLLGGLGLGAFAGPVGILAGGLLGGLFGKRNDAERQALSQHQKRLEELLSTISKQLRPQEDVFRFVRGSIVAGSAEKWYGDRKGLLGKQILVGAVGG